MSTVPPPATPARPSPGPDRRSLQLVLIVFTVALLVAAAVGVADLRRHHEVKTLRERLDRADLQQSAQAASASSANRHVTLISADRVSTVDAVLTSDTSGFLIEGDLPNLDDSQTYQLFAVSQGQPISVGILGRSIKATAFTMPEGATELQIVEAPLAGFATPSSTAVVSATVPA